MVGRKYKRWQALTTERPSRLADIAGILLANRRFTPLTQLAYGDYGLNAVIEVVADAIAQGRRIGLYADYDVDGTMSCV